MCVEPGPSITVLGRTELAGCLPSRVGPRLRCCRRNGWERHRTGLRCGIVSSATSRVVAAINRVAWTMLRPRRLRSPSRSEALSDPIGPVQASRTAPSIAAVRSVAHRRHSKAGESHCATGMYGRQRTPCPGMETLTHTRPRRSVCLYTYSFEFLVGRCRRMQSVKS